MKNQELARSQYARSKILALTEIKNEKDQKELRSYFRSIPADILVNGLINTLVFMQSKTSNSNYAEILKILNDWISSENQNMIEDSKDIISYSSNSKNYIDILYITEEVLQISIWLKRFAEIHLKEE
jgi:CRISPR type III-B/RAMP module-associated protein Cmr5